MLVIHLVFLFVSPKIQKKKKKKTLAVYILFNRFLFLFFFQRPKDLLCFFYNYFLKVMVFIHIRLGEKKNMSDWKLNFMCEKFEW